MTETEQQQSSPFTVFAILFGLLAISNLLKPFQLLGDQTGFVFLGLRLQGLPNAIAGPAFGVYLLIYAIGIWQRLRYALSMAYVYAGYVLLNLALFNVFTPRTAEMGSTAYMIFGIVYAVIALGVSWGAAVYLTWNKDTLR